MSPDNSANQELTRYLLGEMSEEEQMQLEVRYFGDPQLFAELCALRDNLIDGYVSGGLPPVMRRRFESGIENSWAMNERIRFAETLQQAIDAHGTDTASQHPGRAAPRASWWAFASNYRWLILPPAILMIVLAAGWLVIRSRRQSLTDGYDAGVQTSPSTAADKLRDSSLAPSPRVASEAANPLLTVALTSDLVASASDVSAEIMIPQNTIIVKLLLMVEHPENIDYRVAVTAHEGSEIFKTDHLTPHPNEAGKAVELFVPANRLPEGDYVVRLSGVTADNEMVTAGNYYLRVRRR